jgi:predicted metal-dependent HD superfamily phosphohydrolase
MNVNLFSERRWLGLHLKLEIPNCIDICDTTYKWIQSAYTAPGRIYHDTDHISRCLMELDKAKSVPYAPVAYRSYIEYALWFHDVIHNLRAAPGTNESLSAGFARAFIQEHNAKGGNLVSKLILTTNHQMSEALCTHGGEDQLACQYMVDIDLSGLGYEYDWFREDNYNVWREYEYAGFSWDEFKAGNRKFLAKLLERPHIYYTQEFQDLYEARAQDNIKRLLQEDGE